MTPIYHYENAFTGDAFEWVIYKTDEGWTEPIAYCITETLAESLTKYLNSRTL